MNRRLFNILIVILLSASIVYYYFGRREFDNLKENGILTTGYVIEVFDAFRADVGLKYYFFYKGKKIEDKDFYKISINIRKEILGKSLPVIYLPNDPTDSRLLLTRGVFESMGFPFPDSLKWIDNYALYKSFSPTLE